MAHPGYKDVLLLINDVCRKDSVDVIESLLVGRAG